MFLQTYNENSPICLRRRDIGSKNPIGFGGIKSDLTEMKLLSSIPEVMGYWLKGAKKG
jgi:hypothetical protein